MSASALNDTRPNCDIGVMVAFLIAIQKEGIRFSHIAPRFSVLIYRSNVYVSYMDLQIPLEDLPKYKSRDAIPLKCTYCKNIFHRKKHFIQDALKNSRPFNFCGRKCAGEFKASLAKIEFICEECGVHFKRLRNSRRKAHIYCSRKCANKSSRRPKSPLKDCPNCGTKHIRSRFCSVSCKKQFTYESFIRDWLSGEQVASHYKDVNCQVHQYIRKYLFEQNKNCCQKCFWSIKNEFTGKVPLQIHHKDGNCQNNCIENLELLCPNCHSLTKNFGSGNKGNSKRSRRPILDPELA